MGRPKALLPIDGVRFVEKIVAALKSTGVGNIIVVLGHHAEEMTKNRRPARNHPESITTIKQGQLSSLQVAIRHLESSSDGSPVDGIWCTWWTIRISALPWSI